MLALKWIIVFLNNIIYTYELLFCFDLHTELNKVNDVYLLFWFAAEAGEWLKAVGYRQIF